MIKLIAAAAVLAAMPALAQDFGAPLPEDALHKVAGKADLAQDVRSNNSATVANNRVIGNSTTGVITIDGNAFNNLNGLAIVSANTGNNVAINAALNVNVAIRP